MRVGIYDATIINLSLKNKSLNSLRNSNHKKKIFIDQRIIGERFKDDK